MKDYLIVTVWACAMIAFSLLDGSGPMHNEPRWLVVLVWGFRWAVGMGVVAVWRWFYRVKPVQRGT